MLSFFGTYAIGRRFPQILWMHWTVLPRSPAKLSLFPHPWIPRSLATNTLLLFQVLANSDGSVSVSLLADASFISGAATVPFHLHSRIAAPKRHPLLCAVVSGNTSSRQLHAPSFRLAATSPRGLVRSCS